MASQPDDKKIEKIKQAADSSFVCNFKLILKKD